jgi:hypothetical protein
MSRLGEWWDETWGKVKHNPAILPTTVRHRARRAKEKSRSGRGCGGAGRHHANPRLRRCAFQSSGSRVSKTRDDRAGLIAHRVFCHVEAAFSRPHRLKRSAAWRRF